MFLKKEVDAVAHFLLILMFGIHISIKASISNADLQGMYLPNSSATQDQFEKGVQLV